MNDQPTRVGDFCWVELCADTLDTIDSFYRPLFNWTREEMPLPDGGNYVMLQVQGHPIAGAFQLTDQLKKEGAMPCWNAYVLVDNADQSALKAKELGGMPLKEPFDVMENGRMAVIADPANAVFSLWQAKNEMPPPPSFSQHGMFCWAELLTNDVKQAGQYYHALFGWEAKEKEMMPDHFYTSFVNQGKPIAGMMAMPADLAGTPPNWGIYFSVTDLSHTMKQAVELGGEPLYEPMTIPTVGQFVAIKDPAGIVFSIIQHEQPAA